jgi:hypothetical protein
MNEAPSRAEQRERSRKRIRVVAGVAGGLILVVVVAILVVGGGDGGKPTTTSPRRHTNVALTLGDVAAESAGPPAQVTSDQSAAILEIVRAYVDEATVHPLRAGTRADDLSALFDPGALARVTGIDRPVMLDEGLPKVTGNLDVTGQPLKIVALADKNGAIVLATVTIDLDISGVTKASRAPLHIVRRGDFVLVPDASGSWKITAFNIAVTRTGAGLDPTTTTITVAGTTTGKTSK